VSDQQSFPELKSRRLTKSRRSEMNSTRKIDFRFAVSMVRCDCLCTQECFYRGSFYSVSRFHLLVEGGRRSALAICKW
jgi:hypothetical protein